MVTFRTNEVEHLKIKLNAEKQGLSKGDYIRKKLLKDE